MVSRRLCVTGATAPVLSKPSIGQIQESKYGFVSQGPAQVPKHCKRMLCVQVTPPDRQAAHLFARWPHSDAPPATMVRTTATAARAHQLYDSDADSSGSEGDGVAARVEVRRRWLRRVEHATAPSAAAALLRLPRLTAADAVEQGTEGSAFSRFGARPSRAWFASLQSCRSTE